MEINLEYKLWPKQKAAYLSEATEILFGGATGGGKSHLIRVALCCWCLDIPDLQCVLVRKKHDDILKNHVEGPTGFKQLLAPLVELGQVVITQKGIRFIGTRSLISFQHCQDERQFTSAQGVEKHVLIVDEATQISERLIRFFRSWARLSEEVKKKLPPKYRGRFPRIMYTANPIGPSVGYFRRNFVKARPENTIEEKDGFKRQYIPSRAADNLSLSAEETKARLDGLGDPALAKALFEGDWDAPVGEFFPEWSESRHVIPDFTPPAHWFRFRGFDWGTADPFAVYWGAISDGETFTDEDNNRRWYPRGAMIIYKEWYGCDEEDPSKGLRMRNEDMAIGICRRSDKYERNLITISDSFPFADRGGKTIAETFYENGCPLTLGDTTRVTGWSQLRSRLIGIEVDSNDKDRTPMLFVTEGCKYLRDYLPALPRHPNENKKEDAAEHGEATHAADVVRLMSMARPMVISAPKAPADPKDLKQEITFNQALSKIQSFKRSQNASSW